MANLPIKDGGNTDKFLKSTGDGSDIDPFVPEHSVAAIGNASTAVASDGDLRDIDTDNEVATYLGFAANTSGNASTALSSNFLLRSNARLLQVAAARIQSMAAQLPSTIGYANPTGSLSVLFARCQPATLISPYSAVSITNVTAQSNLSPQKIDLNSYDQQGVYNLGVEIATNATAPGASRSLTLYYAFSQNDLNTGNTSPNTVPQQLNYRRNILVCNLDNTASCTREFETGRFEQTARYLYLWYDHSARDASSQLTLTVRLSAI